MRVLQPLLSVGPLLMPSPAGDGTADRKAPTEPWERVGETWLGREGYPELVLGSRRRGFPLGLGPRLLPGPYAVVFLDHLGSDAEIRLGELIPDLLPERAALRVGQIGIDVVEVREEQE